LDYRKLLIVDGRVGFLGGYNLGELYATQWRDTHLRLRGPIAEELALSFSGFWNSFCLVHERMMPRYHHRFDALIPLCQNEVMRAASPICERVDLSNAYAEVILYLGGMYFSLYALLFDWLFVQRVSRLI
jgi:cardiolipin synthase